MHLRTNLLQSLATSWLTILALFACTLPSAATAQGINTITGYGSPQGGPLTLGKGKLAFTVSPPGTQPIQFTCEATEPPANPGLLFVATSPLGPMALLPGLILDGSGYMLHLAGTSTAIPLGWNEGLDGYSGNVGDLRVDVIPVPAPGLQKVVDQNGPGTEVFVLGGKNELGQNTFRVVVQSQADIAFLQFFSLKFTWEGVRANGDAASGTFAGPVQVSGNGGNPIASDGSRTYVDGPSPGGYLPSYPREPIGGGRWRYTMDDAPNLGAPRAVASLVEAANTGVTVTAITFHIKLTTYVVMVTPLGSTPIARLDWSCKERVVIDANTPANHVPNGDLLGENEGPAVPGSPFAYGYSNLKTGPEAALDPGHKDAFLKFRGTPPDFSGTGSLPW